MQVAILIPDATYAQLYPSDVQARLRGLGPVAQATGDRAALAEQASALLAQAEVLLAGPGTPALQEEWLDGAPRLRLIGYSTGSVRGII
ncbi:MAG: hypothetical protein ACHQ7M_20775, partial [Chloroflexota bacterium]